MARTASTRRKQTILSVYRYRGWYHSRYMAIWTGIKFADEVPRNTKAYQLWLKLTQETLDDRLEQLRRESGSPDQDHYTGHGYIITRTQPRCYSGFFGIDLDNEVFYVQSMPMFRLDGLPGRGADMKSCIGYDSYRHPICSPSTPKECRYHWHVPPPSIPQAIIDLYGSRSMENPIVPVHELLDISESMSAPESTRVSLFQEIIKSGMRMRHVASSIRHLEGVGHREGIPTDLVTFGCILMGISRGPFIYSGKDHTHIMPKDEAGYTWLDPQTFLRFTTHLDDERNLQATVVDLVTAAIERPMTHGIVFGIGLSFFHCVIVRINLDDCGSFKHTPVLQFLPPFDTQSSSTPGITALVRLGYLSEPLDLLGILPGKLPRAHLLNNMPLELWSLIAHDFFSVNDFIALASLSPSAWTAANELLKFPHIGDSRMIGLKSNMPFNEPAEFEVSRGGGWADLDYKMLVGTDFSTTRRWDEEEDLVVGEVCFQCKWDDPPCECTDQCYCHEERPWIMSYEVCVK